jgi:hypothetical protein
MQINRQKEKATGVGRRSVGTTKKSDTVKGADLLSEGPASKHKLLLSLKVEDEVPHGNSGSPARGLFEDTQTGVGPPSLFHSPQRQLYPS